MAEYLLVEQMTFPVFGEGCLTKVLTIRDLLLTRLRGGARRDWLFFLGCWTCGGGGNRGGGEKARGGAGCVLGDLFLFLQRCY